MKVYTDNMIHFVQAAGLSDYATSCKYVDLNSKEPNTFYVLSLSAFDLRIEAVYAFIATYFPESNLHF